MGWQCFVRVKKKKTRHFAVVSTKQNNNPFGLTAKGSGENGPMLSPAVICVLLGCWGSAGAGTVFSDEILTVGVALSYWLLLVRNEGPQGTV